MKIILKNVYFVFQVREILIHDSFQGSDDFQADIALLSLESKVELSLFVIPACYSSHVDLVEKDAIGEVSELLLSRSLHLIHQAQLPVNCLCNRLLGSVVLIKRAEMGPRSFVM